MQKRFLHTDMALWLVVVLVVIMLPRGILNDMNIVAEGTLGYYVLALTPFAVWLAVAVFRKTKKPMRDFTVLGVLYGVFLGLTHLMFWGISWSHHPPGIATTLADKVDPALGTLVAQGVTFSISLAIGLGAGLIYGLIAVVAMRLRTQQTK